MLVELSVENYAVIEQVRVRFHSGLNLLTGETAEVGETMLKEWLEKAGAEGKALVDAYRKL